MVSHQNEFGLDFANEAGMRWKVWNCYVSVMVNRNLFLGSDTESNDEPVVGNVSKYCVLPPSYSGKPKKGNLVFDACFESGKSFNIYSLILYSS